MPRRPTEHRIDHPVRRSRFILGVIALVIVAAVVVARLAASAPVSAADACTAPPNPVVAENCKPGNPKSEWDISGSGSANIQGFATQMSYAQGETAQFKIRSTTATAYRIDIYRLGWYGGDGARKVATVNPSAALPQSQPACLSQSTTGLIDCGNWANSASWAIPGDAVSGIYIAKLTATAGTTGSSHIVFVVRNDASTSDIVYQTADTTWQAYNSYGGNSLYAGGPGTNPSRAYKVSYNRPFSTRGTSTEDFLFNSEYPMIRWLERNGYDLSYFSGIDTDRRGSVLQNHRLFISSGHDEYWSGAQRANLTAARDAGVNLAFFSGNTMFWKTRWEASIDGSSTSHRTLVSYKETHANAKIDPVANVWTGTWRDNRSFNPEGSQPENTLTGQLFAVNSGTTAMRVPASYGKLRPWRNTSVANLAPGQTATLAANTVGYEWDSDIDNGRRPAGLIGLSKTTVNAPEVLQDQGSTYAPGTVDHTLTLYRDENGAGPDALVFNTGTVQWAWGLDDVHDRGSAAADPDMQQATVNVLADLKAQPATLQSGLAPASASSDGSAPEAVITAPANGDSVQDGVAVTISGTASDGELGGAVAGVEVSVDGGATWRPAQGTTNWTYSWKPNGTGPATIRARAADDSANLQATPATASVNVVPNAPSTCPCTLFDAGQAPASQAVENDGTPLELGVKFTADVDGIVTGVRFYKVSGNTGTHIGRLYNASGTQLASATFTSESASGWQEVQFSSAVSISADATYTASYYSAAGGYSSNIDAFAATLDNPPLHAPAGANGVYRYGTGGGFPTASWRSSNYWVDVVFRRAEANDTTPPAILSTAPAAGAVDVDPGGGVTATFNEAIDPATVTTSTFRLTGPGGASVPAAVSYDPTSRIALLTPQSPLANTTSYTATVSGGASGVADLAGNRLAQNRSWTFTTAAPAPPPPTDGPGGPILVLRSAGDPWTSYYAEILRAEGLNAFATADVSTVSAQSLAPYRVVVLAQTGLSAAQVSTLASWVQGGGNLIAMRPDKKLAGLLGLTDAGGTLADAYLTIDTTTSIGEGLTGRAIQYHGTADRYAASGATPVAQLWSSATNTTSAPAVTVRDVGTSGGQAAAFTYDLARSVVQLRQGNPQWAGDERDGQAPVRSDDQFYGAKSGDAKPDWVDLDNVAIPQADEQQRLLANLITRLTLDAMPLPRLWYLPSGHRAAVVLTGDDHAGGGTAGQFDERLDESPGGCSVADWECVRASSYVYPSTPLTDSEVAAYEASGFEIALHVNTNCADYTPSSLAAFFDDELADFTARWPSAVAPKTNRTHCIVWSDWSGTPEAERARGIRLDTNYYYWPPNWVQDRPGMFTGSGFPMRFAAANGSMIDVYQAATQITDESGQDIPATIASLLDGATGPLERYGVFTANMHTDTSTNASAVGARDIVAAARARGVPVVSARQMLTWLDGRNGSSFGGLSYAARQLRFSLTPGAGARNLRGMVPTQSPDGLLQGLTRNGAPVTTTERTVKGVSYAFFPATSGDYVASYANDTTAPVISDVRAVNVANGTATIRWTTDEPSSSRVQFGIDPAGLTGSVSDPAQVSDHQVTLTGLADGTTFHYRVTSADGAGNATTSPAPPDAPASFSTPKTLSDSSLAQFSAGSAGSATLVGPSDAGPDGEVQLLPALNQDFDGTSVPSDWTSAAWATGGASTLAGGLATVNGARLGTTAAYAVPRTLEFTATFGSAAFQHAGLGVDYNAPPWAIFSTGGGALPVGLYARTAAGSSATNTAIGGVSPTATHRYRIVWGASSVQFFVDDALVATHNLAISTAMRPLISDYTTGGPAVSTAWLRLGPYASSGTFSSRVLDAGTTSSWLGFASSATTPAGTGIAFETRSGGTATPDGSWSAWAAVGAGAIASPAARYLQYRAVLTSSATSATPTLQSVSIASRPQP